MYSAHLSPRASAPTGHNQQFSEQPKDTRKGACHNKEGITAMPRAKPERENPSGKPTNEEKAWRAGLFRPKDCWNKDRDH